MAVIDILYDEGNKENLQYKSVSVSSAFRKAKKRFFSGDFVKDWYDCMKFVITDERVNKDPLCHSSSVDHFIMDGAPYDSAYLHQIKGKAVLKYINHKDENWAITQQDICAGIEFFVKKGTKPTWNKLRTLCGDPPEKK